MTCPCWRGIQGGLCIKVREGGNRSIKEITLHLKSNSNGRRWNELSCLGRLCSARESCSSSTVPANFKGDNNKSIAAVRRCFRPFVKTVTFCWATIALLALFFDYQNRIKLEGQVQRIRMFMMFISIYIISVLRYSSVPFKPGLE